VFICPSVFLFLKIQNECSAGKLFFGKNWNLETKNNRALKCERLHLPVESNTLTTPRAPPQFLAITAVQGMRVEQRLRVSEVRKSAEITRKRSRK